MHPFLIEELPEEDLVPPAIHPKFQPFLDDIQREATEGQGPRAAIGLAVECLTAVAKMIEIVCTEDPVALGELQETDVTVGDMITLVEHLGDVIDGLYEKYSN